MRRVLSSQVPQHPEILPHHLLALAVTEPSLMVVPDLAGGSEWAKTPADEAARVHFTISLKQRNTDELKKIALDVSTPGHPRYGMHLSQREIDELTAPTPLHGEAVTAWLRSAGCTFDVKRELILVSTTVSTAASLLRTKFYVYRRGQSELLRASSYALPSHVSGSVATIFGLHGMPLPTGSRRRCAACTSCCRTARTGRTRR